MKEAIANKGLFINRETEDKIQKLIDAMTLDEKVGQMTQSKILPKNALKEQWERIPEDQRKARKNEFDLLNNETLQDKIIQGKIGSVIIKVRGSKVTNELQRIAVEKSRLGIPLIFASDVLHGFRTIFPICLAESSSWEPELLEDTAAISAREAASCGEHWIFAPVVDIARDSRWARCVEGFGEDVFLSSVYAAARIKGYQRNDWEGRPHVVACPKHFAAYGACEAGIDYTAADMSEHTLREVYLPPFKAAFDAGAGTVMISFNELNGIPATANEFLVKRILKTEWGFQGVTVSDHSAIAELIEFGYTENLRTAAKKAAEAGVDMDMSSGTYLAELADLVRDGSISEDIINESVRRILRVKFGLGLFDNPYVDENLENEILLHKEHLDLALKAARKSIVLLKNEENLLPLKKNKGTIAVIGPYIDEKRELLGNWSTNGREQDVVTIIDGIRKKAGSSMNILCAKGCSLYDKEMDSVKTLDSVTRGDYISASSVGVLADDEKEIQKAVALAKQADVAVVFLGEGLLYSVEASFRMTQELPQNHQRLLRSIYETGTPVVLVLINGRPLSIPWEAEHIPAIIEAWQLGTQAGNAIADVLFGDFNPSGKLPITFPKHIRQQPIYYAYKKIGRMQYRYYDPQYPFGYGLSYTDFEYTNLMLSSARIEASQTIKVSAEIKNTGDREGEEIVQIYIQDICASIIRPIKELRGFQKIFLLPGESKTAEFFLGKDQLGFYNESNEYVVEPGEFKVWIGPNSSEGLEGKFEVITGCRQ